MEDFEQQGQAGPDTRGRRRQAYEGNDLAALVRELAGAQANDTGWPLFKGKYEEYPRFRKEWWATEEFTTSTSETSWYATP